MLESGPFSWWLPVAIAPFVGSFLGVVALRMPAGRDALWGRSQCPHCGHFLTAIDLVPLASWAVNRGRCRHCGASVGLFYPVMELAAVVIALWAASEVSGWLLCLSCALGWTLLTLSVIDQEHFLLPDALTLPLAVTGLAVAADLNAGAIGDHILGAFAGFSFFAAVCLLYRRVRGREGLGWGDAKLLCASGAWLSWQALPTVVAIGAASALIATVIGSVWRRTVSANVPIPFGPHLCLATWLTWLYGPLLLG
ncbi:MAG: prepilin peptidase [Hyphomicrobiales bacterium]|nr:prepilin peptidase [Hyphomicrobiales bacterium]